MLTTHASKFWAAFRAHVPGQGTSNDLRGSAEVSRPSSPPEHFLRPPRGCSGMETWAFQKGCDHLNFSRANRGLSYRRKSTEPLVRRHKNSVRRAPQKYQSLQGTDHGYLVLIREPYLPCIKTLTELQKVLGLPKSTIKDLCLF